MNLRKLSGIYIIKNTVNGHCYVGQAASIGDRWYTHKSHLSKGYHHSAYLQHAWNKYGSDSFSFEVLEFVEKDRDILAKREQFWFDKLSPEYNIAPVAGSSLGLKHPPRTDEFRKRMSDMKRGHKKSPETIERQKASYAANPFKLTPEHRAKLIAANTGRVRSPEEKEKWRAKMIGIKQSTKHIAKRVEKLIGHTVSVEARAKIGAANSARLKGTKQSQELIEKRIAPLRGRKRPDVTERFKGKKRPDVTERLKGKPAHKNVIEGIKRSNDIIHAELRQKIKSAFYEHPTLSNRAISKLLGCDRNTVDRQRKAIKCQNQQQNDNESTGSELKMNLELLLL
jgi:group I intron endonuclease